MSIPGIVNRNLAIFFVLLAAGFVPWIYRKTRGIGTGSRTNRSSGPTADHFYELLLRALAKRGFSRAPEQTPVEFLGSLRERKAPCLEEIGDVTRVFCDSKYGELPLPEAEARRLAALLERVEKAPEIVR